MKNDKLAIAIPTYNRARILKENLSYMMDEIKKYNIPIYISDDSDNNDTLMVVNELKTIYEYIYYYKNKPSLGHDKNCFFTLNLPSEDHIWYLGDSVIIEKGTIFLVLELLKKAKYDFVVTNHKGRNLNIASKLFIDAKDVFSDLAWHLTLSGVTIYRKKIIENYKVKGIYKNFPQTSIILNSISENCNLYYIHDAIFFL